MLDFKRELYNHAETFIRACCEELGKTVDEVEQRLSDIREHISKFGTYEHTYEELEHGARMAWRNSNRCIGRLFWQSLKVFDARDLETDNEIFAALLRHVEYATNGGRIRPTITVFKVEREESKVRIWNHQLLRYAGYETESGIVGDPQSIEFTRVCESLGWKSRGTRFDVLPFVIQVDNRSPKWFSIPEDLALEVAIRHPDLPCFDELQLQWYAVPIISDMVLEIGGIRYSAAPFNGWYMETEIGARNLADTKRYDMLPEVARLMGLDTKSDSSLWKDRALVELNVAVLHSFKAAGVSIVDHHTAAKQFERFENIERDAGRSLTGDWTWLIPPVSPATTHVFHQPYDNRIVSPNYFYQDSPY